MSDAKAKPLSTVRTRGEPFYRHRHTVRYDVWWDDFGPDGDPDHDLGEAHIVRAMANMGELVDLDYVNARCCLCRSTKRVMRRKSREPVEQTEVRAMDMVKHEGNCGLLKAASIMRRRGAKRAFQRSKA